MTYNRDGFPKPKTQRGQTMGKPILDACCGSRMFWYDKDNPAVVFMD